MNRKEKAIAFWKNYWWLVATVLAVAIFISVMSYTSALQYRARDDFLYELDSLGLEVQRGTVEDPVLIIELNQAEFIQKISETNTTTVYWNGSCTFYLLEADFKVIYRYRM